MKSPSRRAVGAAVLFCAVALLCTDVGLRACSPEVVSLLDLDRSEPGFVEFPRDTARWWGEARAGYGYDKSGRDRLGEEQEFDHVTTPLGGDIDHYDYPRRDRTAGHRFGFAPSQKKVGWGPVYYGDTKIYGASVGKNFRKQPYPVYTDYMTEGAARASGRDQEGYWRQTMEMPEGYMQDFAKDFLAYFPEEDSAGEKVPNPIEAGYWPYATPDGYLASGDAGSTGEAWRSFAEEDKKSDSGGESVQGGGDMDDVDAYLDAESSVYTDDMRYYLNDDWP